MPKLYAQSYTKEQILQRVGDISQIGGVRLQTRADGVERGVRTADFRTGTGLDFSVLIDRGLDISTAEYCGQALAWRSATADRSPAYFEEPGLGWLRSFYGGLVVTCGLTYAGAPTTDQGKPLGLHGRVSNTPATNVYADGEWQGDDYVMWVQGKVREAIVFGENIEMTRRITAKLGESRIWIHDKVTNMGHKDTEHMILYHINIGFPVIDEGGRLIGPIKGYQPRDDDAMIEKEKYADFPAPTVGFRERVYYLDMVADKNGDVSAALVNPNFRGGQGFGVYIKYPKKELPEFTEWKMNDAGTYVVGMEPANCRVEGRDKERARGALQFLKPGETREYHLEIGLLNSPEDVKAFEAQVAV